VEPNRVPFRKTVFVCTNKRADGRPACANSGRDGEAICEALKHAVKEAGLKKEIRVARSGCLDLCEKGPNVFVYPEGRWYSGLTLADVPQIVKSL
jgi:predicted metal-binding protein